MAEAVPNRAGDPARRLPLYGSIDMAQAPKNWSSAEVNPELGYTTYENHPGFDTYLHPWEEGGPGHTSLDAEGPVLRARVKHTGKK
jgi:hypothetical protein